MTRCYFKDQTTYSIKGKLKPISLSLSIASSPPQTQAFSRADLEGRLMQLNTATECKSITGTSFLG